MILTAIKATVAPKAPVFWSTRFRHTALVCGVKSTAGLLCIQVQCSDRYGPPTRAEICVGTEKRVSDERRDLSAWVRREPVESSIRG